MWEEREGEGKKLSTQSSWSPALVLIAIELCNNLSHAVCVCIQGCVCVGGGVSYVGFIYSKPGTIHALETHAEIQFAVTCTHFIVVVSLDVFVVAAAIAAAAAVIVVVLIVVVAGIGIGIGIGPF